MEFIKATATNTERFLPYNRLVRSVWLEAIGYNRLAIINWIEAIKEPNLIK